MLVQAGWMTQGRPSLHDQAFSASMRFYGARRDADLDNLIKAILDALNYLAFDDDRQLVCLSGCHKLPVDEDGPRTEIDLWAA
jgi:Holliday junction resolvase RusA-like endonuclease